MGGEGSVDGGDHVVVRLVMGVGVVVKRVRVGGLDGGHRGHVGLHGEQRAVGGRLVVVVDVDTAEMAAAHVCVDDMAVGQDVGEGALVAKLAVAFGEVLAGRALGQRLVRVQKRTGLAGLAGALAVELAGNVGCVLVGGRAAGAGEAHVAQVAVGMVGVVVVVVVIAVAVDGARWALGAGAKGLGRVELVGKGPAAVVVVGAVAGLVALDGLDGLAGLGGLSSRGRGRGARRRKRCRHGASSTRCQTDTANRRGEREGSQWSEDGRLEDQKTGQREGSDCRLSRDRPTRASSSLPAPSLTAPPPLLHRPQTTHSRHHVTRRRSHLAPVICRNPRFTTVASSHCPVILSILLPALPHRLPHRHPPARLPAYQCPIRMIPAAQLLLYHPSSKSSIMCTCGIPSTDVYALNWIPDSARKSSLKATCVSRQLMYP
jgi:hypothetical protein